MPFVCNITRLTWCNTTTAYYGYSLLCVVVIAQCVLDRRYSRTEWRRRWWWRLTKPAAIVSFHEIIGLQLYAVPVVIIIRITVEHSWHLRSQTRRRRSIISEATIWKAHVVWIDVWDDKWHINPSEMLAVSWIDLIVLFSLESNSSGKDDSIFPCHLLH